MQIKKAISQFLQHLSATGYSPHTIRAYALNLRGLLFFCGNNGMETSKLSPAMLTEFLISDHAHVGPTGTLRGEIAINHVRVTLRSFCNWLCQTGQIRTNPTAALRLRYRPKPPPVGLAKDDEQKLLKAMAEAKDSLAFRDRLMTAMLLRTGVRVAELLALDIDDVDLENRLVHIRAKGGTEQVRYLTQDTVPPLNRYLVRWRMKLPTVSQGLFVGTTGKRITTRQFSRRLDQWQQKAGISERITPHTFRHTLANRLLDKTGNLRLVQQALGHRSIASTLRYAQVPSKALVAALEAV